MKKTSDDDESDCSELYMTMWNMKNCKIVTSVKIMSASEDDSEDRNYQDLQRPPAKKKCSTSIIRESTRGC